jgi:hypothetical protein
MPTFTPSHGCIPCAITSVRCCICAGHTHGTYGLPDAMTQSFETARARATAFPRPASQRPAFQGYRDYIRQFAAQDRYIGQQFADYARIAPIMRPDTVNTGPNKTLCKTLWDHLTDQDDSEP